MRLAAVGGPLDGQTFEFGPNRTLITLGRPEDREIRFPGDFRPISRAHNKQIDSNENDISYPWIEFEAERRQKVLVVMMGEHIGQRVPLRVYLAPAAKAPKKDG